MKKLVFAFVLFLSVFLTGMKEVYADKYSYSDENYSFEFTREVKSSVYEYTFNFTFYKEIDLSYVHINSIASDGTSDYAYKLKETESTILYDENGDFEKGFFTGNFRLGSIFDSVGIYVEFKLPDGSIIYLMGDDKSVVVPEVTPVPTPTSTPKPTPTSTPKPTPTNTPKPTPTPAPILELNAFITSKDAVAQYKTGGCTPVQSMIEFYEVDITGGLNKVNSEQFLSGSGTMRNTMTPGKVYRYKLTYIYQNNGVQYEKYLWSNDLSVVDQELEEYRSNKKIVNFRTLMIYCWEEVMKLEMPIEGFHISFQTIFIWVLVAIAIFTFIKHFKE